MLHEAFAAKIADTTKKTAFDKDSKGLSIYPKYLALHNRLSLMSAAKRLPRALAESVGSQLPGAFQMARNYRNEAGHPALGAEVTSDAMFLSLRDLAAHFQTANAEW